ncbi:MAG: penicillin-binding protein 1B [SAR324 cluster bacterium]|nr:penicillin-binding protein 1B [SAR324 cluster bacterium]
MQWRHWWWKLGLLISIVVAAVFYRYLSELDEKVQQQFAGKRWALPTSIYGRPLEIYPGMRIRMKELLYELSFMQYQSSRHVKVPGDYRAHRSTIELKTRPFPQDAHKEPSRHLKLRFDSERLVTMTDLSSQKSIDIIRLNPPLIGRFYPKHGENRVLVQLSEVPSTLVQMLIATEDRKFYEHIGIDVSAILRATVKNIQEMRVVQGASTLTQQLVKNFFLTREQTLRRKFEEVFMAMLLEWHYEKEEILEAYLNEVYLGQDGEHAIHGVAQGSYFYFGRPLQELQLHQQALLVSVLKGPSQYNPRRFPKKALLRRNLILSMMASGNTIEENLLVRSAAKPLEIVKKVHSSESYFPAFLELVKRQLLEEYAETDLQSEGLQVYTTFDPQLQRKMETAIQNKLKQLEAKYRIPPNTLETASILTDTSSGELLAMVGGRHFRFPGFNRALDAKRPIGSLIKPVVYLSALSKANDYHLMSMLDDSPLDMVINGKKWQPQNYDRIFRGSVPFYKSLAHSYNVPSIRLGLEVGLESIEHMLKQLGFQRAVKLFPSSLLGTLEMSVFEVGQMYYSLASGGFVTPIQTIRSVSTQAGIPLKRYPLAIEQTLDVVPVYLLNVALKSVLEEGTGKKLKKILPKYLEAAGKTGTTNDLRDSWFAGYTGDRLAVVWIGKDNNQPTKLTGSSGAMMVWGDIIKSIPNKSLQLHQPENVEWLTVDQHTGALTDDECPNAIRVPFTTTARPVHNQSCPDLKKQQKHELEVVNEKPAQTPILEAPVKQTDLKALDNEQEKGIFDWLKGLFK